MTLTLQNSQPPARDALQIEELRTVENLADIGAEWHELWQRSGQTPFQSPMWLVPWVRQFTTNDLVVLAIRFGPMLIGVAPFYSWRDNNGRSKLLLAGNGISDYLDVCVDPVHRGCVRTALEGWLEKQDWACCEFDQLTEDSIIRQFELVGSSILAADSCPVLDLRGRSPSDYAPARQLGKLRYYRRRAEKLGSLAIETATTTNCAEAMNELFRLHALRWSGRGEPGVLQGSAIQEFHFQAAESLARTGCLRLYSLRIDSQTLGVLYGLANSESTFFYLSGFDPKFEKLSPGTILIGHAIEQAIAGGHREFNFLRGSEPYKYAWGARDQGTFRWLRTADNNKLSPESRR